MRRLLFSFIAILAASALARPATAQQPPAGAVRAPQPMPRGGLLGGLRPPDPTNPDRASQQLTFRLDLAGGYDRLAGEREITNLFNQAGTIGSSAAEIRHRYGSARNYLDSVARGHMALAEVGLRQQVTGTAQVQGGLALGRRARITINGDAGYQPTYLFNAFGSLAGQAANDVVTDAAIPGAELSEGFTEERWLVSGVSTRLHRNWTPRQLTEIHYGTTRRSLIRDLGNYSTSHTAALRHDWSYRERVSVLWTYQIDESRQRGGDAEETPIRSHRAGLGLRFQKRFPRGRALYATFAGGATQSQTRATLIAPSAEFIVPSMNAGLQAQLSRWTWAIDANRNVTVLEGLTPIPFVTNAGSFSLQGRLGHGIQVVSTAAYSRGIARDATTGEFETGVGSFDVMFPFGRIVSMTTSYAYYGHQLFDLAEVQARVPSRQQRHSVRVGFRVWLPLFGTF